MATVLLAVIAIAGGSYLYQSRAGVSIQRNKRIAFEIANSRIEDVRASNYDDVKPSPGNGFSIRYLTPPATPGNPWNVTASNPNETVNINGLSLPITTTVQYMDVDGGSATRDYLRIVVNVGYRLNSAERVTLETFYAP